jgi:hypothetical protein
MATNRRPTVPDAQATPEIERAMLQIDRLIRLNGAPVPVTTAEAVPNELHNWDLAGPAMLFSATSCLLSLRWLAEAPKPYRTQDAIVLLRRLYEHAVDFAWISIDPPVRARRWVADDFYHRLRADNDLVRLGRGSLTQELRDEYQAYIDQYGRTRPNHDGRMPDVATRADEADQHWSSRIDGHGTFPRRVEEQQTGVWSLRKMYVAIYRPASSTAHPTAQSLRDFVWPGGASDRFLIGFNTEHPIERYPYTMAPLVFATMLLIAEQVLGRPNGDEVRAAFEK